MALFPTPLAPSSDWWDIAGETCVAAYQPKGAASLAASYSNLANPGTYDAAPGVAPTWASGTGWTFNGTTQYLLTGLIPNDAWTAILRITDVNLAENNRRLFGYTDTSTGDPSFFVRIAPSSAGWIAFHGNTAGSLAFAGGTSGVLCIAAKNVYWDGESEGTIGAGASSVAYGQMAIGGTNTQTGTVSSFLTVGVQAAAFYSTTLDATQVATLSSAMAAL